MLKHDEYNVYPMLNKQQAELLNGQYLKSKGGYRIPKNVHSLRELYKMTGNTEIVPLGIEEKTKLEELQELKKSTLVYDERLREYQNQDVHFISNVEYAGVFLEPRMGKSPITLKAFEVAERKKNCIICPSSLTFNWAKEIDKWTTTKSFIAVGNLTKRKKIYEEYKKAKEGYLIISYETLRSDIDIVEKM